MPKKSRPISQRTPGLGGAISANNYGVKAVEFPAVSYLSEATASVADSNEFTSSGWIFIKSSEIIIPDFRGLAIPIIQFGPQLADFSWHSDPAFNTSPISVITSGVSVSFDSSSGPGFLQFCGSSPDGAVTGRANSAGGTAAGIGWVYAYQHGNSPIPVDQWVHIAVSVRIKQTSATFSGYSPTATWTVNTYGDIIMMINGVDDSPYLQDWYDEKGISGSIINNPPRAIMGSTTVYNGGGDAYINNVGTVISDFDFPAGQTIPQFNMGFSGFSIGTPSDNGNAVQNAAFYYPSGTNPKIRFSDVQVWRKFIDLTAAYGGGTTVKQSQAPTQYGRVPDVGLLNQAVFSAIQAGLDPLYVLTAMNIESAYGTQTGMNSGTNKGILQFDIPAMTDALGGSFTSTSLINNQNQIDAFIASTINPHAGPSYMASAILYMSTDPTGMFSYLGQIGRFASGGSLGTQQDLLNAYANAPTTLIKDLPAPTPTNALGQAWSNVTQLPLQGNSTVTQYFTAYISYWNGVSADAASRLTGGNTTNINAFRTTTGYPVPPIVAASLFDYPTILFSGNKTDFPVNTGTSEITDVFTLQNGPLTDFTPVPP